MFDPFEIVQLVSRSKQSSAHVHMGNSPACWRQEMIHEDMQSLTPRMAPKPVGIALVTVFEQVVKTTIPQ